MQLVAGRQFNRAVEIVHGLPKTGPIQTAYEDKLDMYSLFKQATAGDVKTPRPGMFDMLGRAKWDAWEKQRGLDQQQAKWLYVQTLQRVLRRYSDRTVARDLVRELDSYNVDTSNFVMSQTRSSSPDGSSSSGSSSPQPVQAPSDPLPDINREAQGEVSQSYEEITPNERGGRPITSSPPIPGSFTGRPASALSSHMRYRTPMATAGGMSPVPTLGIRVGTPHGQPLPRYATPSAFAPQHPGPLPHPSQSASTISYPTTSVSYPQASYARGGYTPTSGAGPSNSTPPQRSPLERAIESMQTSLAALHERIDGLEASMLGGGLGESTPPMGSMRRAGSFSPHRGGSRPESPSPLPFDPNQTGAWSIFLRPVYLVLLRFRRLLHFMAYPPNPQNTTARLIIIRRLMLDATFLVFVMALIRRIWRATGMRRTEVLKALVGVWHAITGTQARTLIDKAVGN
ncbi:hypothetical protein FRB94_004886 [Tulasnella sp. JGI-2019a]|nr:hypothetical protein FRB93_005821 [Tulasnella sp. JGI-2019a]KAG9001233.1 hypothetical protein FRB94_004886 [Tulasnella sp. JGI-2019a]